MKKTLLILLLHYFLFANEASIFKIYYLSLSEYQDLITPNIPIIVKSYHINNLFKIISDSNKTIRLSNEYKSLQILIKDKNKNELFITQDKKLLSLSKKEVYPIDVSIIDEIIKEIKQHIKGSLKSKQDNTSKKKIYKVSSFFSYIDVNNKLTLFRTREFTRDDETDKLIKEGVSQCQ